MNRAMSQAVAFLGSAQHKDGSFEGLSGSKLHDYTGALHYPTVFPAALILECLRHVPTATQIQHRAASFLLWQRSEQWSWNYWRRDSAEAREQPYPDDLDDTACVLAALTGQKPEVVDGSVLGSLAQLLTANEVAPGGPYRTWLIDSKTLPQWDDVDIAVNANIGYCLHLHGVNLPNLEAYVTDAIRSGVLESSYYVGIVPVLYFVARWYHGPARRELRRLVERELASPEHADNALMLALLITAAVNLAVPPERLRSGVEQLLALQTDGHWPAEGLYRDPTIDGVAYYAGSEALTTAFAVEALTAYELALAGGNSAAPARKRSRALGRALAESRHIDQPELRRLYQAQLKKFTVAASRQVTEIADITLAACGRKLPAATCLALNLGSLHGWLAYTIYDDFLDNEGKPELLGVANVALRATVRQFKAALPDNAAFHDLVEATLEAVDGANTWEVTEARAHALAGGRWRVRRLPDYGDYAQLARRSWGHVLAPSGVLLALGYKADGPELQRLQQFFRHFLIARQLNDDAHDWEEDVQHGRLTAVTTLLLANRPQPFALKLDANLPALQRRFWEETILEVAKLIREHLHAARAELRRCDFLADTSEYEHWLTELERATREALKGREEAQKFMDAYAAN